jgi:hypothetical protein
VRTELVHLAVIQSLTPHPVQMHRQFARHRHLRSSDFQRATKPKTIPCS